MGVKGRASGNGGGGCTHGHDLEVLDFLSVAQRQHEGLWVGLAVPQQEDAAREEEKVARPLCYSTAPFPLITLDQVCQTLAREATQNHRHYTAQS